MRLPKMNTTERMVFAAVFACVYSSHPSTTDNASAEVALEEALWALNNLRQAVKERADP